MELIIVQYITTINKGFGFISGINPYSPIVFKNKKGENMDLKVFKDAVIESPFYKSYKTVHQSFRHEVSGNYAQYITNCNEFVPNFQRDNDKWTKKMQVSFVENFLMGFESSIFLFYAGEQEFPKWEILDGLQRLTALSLFLDNKLKILGRYYYNDIKTEINDMVQLQIRLYRFDTEKDAVNFYISMNENISHSKKDIKKAKDYLISLDEKNRCSKYQ